MSYVLQFFEFCITCEPIRLSHSQVHIIEEKNVFHIFISQSNHVYLLLVRIVQYYSVLIMFHLVLADETTEVIAIEIFFLFDW